MNKNKRMKNSLRQALGYSLLTLGALAGCANTSPASRQAETLIDRAGVDIVASDSTRQLTYIKERSSTERFCRGPGADSVTTASQGVTAQMPISGSSLGLGEQSTNGAVDLGGRNPAVLIARELMYRACELASNTNADGATERQIYLQFLQVVLAITKVQTGAGIAALASEPAVPALLAVPPPATPTDPTNTNAPPTVAPLAPAFSSAVPGQ